MKGGKQLNRKGLAVGLILVFIVSMVVPMVIGNTTRSMEKYNKYNFDEHRYPEGYHEKSLTNKPCETTAIQNTFKEELVNPVPLNGGPMNSSWPMYCHDVRHTGLSPYSTADNPLTEKWRFPLSWGSFYSGFILDGNGNIYGGTLDIYGIYPNGTEKWQYNAGNPIESTPAIDENGIIYIGTIWGMPNYLHAIYSNNGSLKWKYSVGSNNIDSSPAIGSDGTIYFGDWNSYIHAVYPNGTRKWSYHTSDVVTSSPAIGNDGTIYIGSHDDYVYAFYPNGTVKWRFKTGSWVHASPTIGPDGIIYIGSDDGYLYALNPNNGSMIWRCSIGYSWCSPTLGPDGILYLGVWNMYFYAIYPNGTIKWTYNTPGRIWFGSSATVSSDGTIFFGTTTQDGGSGAFVALNPDGTERYKNTQRTFSTSPAIAQDGTVYVYGNGYLSAFGSGEPKKIEIQSPEPGKLYLFGSNIGSTPRNNTIILGSVTVKIQVYSEDQIESVHFYIDGADQYNITTSPFEWNMNQRYGKLFPLTHTITVTAFYKGGCQWSESIDVLYFHLL